MLSACTVVRIDGPARVTSSHFGILRVEPAGRQAMLAYRIRGVGLVPGREGLTLGYRQEDTAAVYDRSSCQLVLFEIDGDREILAEWRSFVDRHPNICIVNQGGRHDEED